MSNPYVGEIRMFGGNFAPAGWNFCDGSLLAISNYDALFNLIGTTYGGNGQINFAVPDLRGRLPIHQGSGFTLGQNGGAETVTLTVSTIPSHSHSWNASTTGAQASAPANNVTGTSTGATKFYRVANPAIQMSPNSISSTGGSQPHNNFQPYLCVNFIISLFGIYPSQT